MGISRRKIARAILGLYAYRSCFVTTAALAPQDNFLGHPKGVFVCFFTEMWERFSFYGMKALLFLYLTKYHLFNDTSSYGLIGAYGGLVYCIPVIGGLLADKYLGMRKAVIFGGILLVLGHAGMAFEGAKAYKDGASIIRDSGALLVFYFSLSLIIMGVGFLKPNISTIVGKLYAQDDPRRDSGFSLFYAGINLGALLASLVCGYLGETYGWSYGFGAAGVGMLAGLMMFIWGQKYLHGHAESNAPAKLKEIVFAGLQREWIIYIGAIAGLTPIAALMWATANDSLQLGGLSPALLLMLVVMCIVVIWFIVFILTQCTSIERNRMIALMMMIVMALIFFSLYEQTYGSWVAFTDRLLTKDFFPSLIVEKKLPLLYYVVTLLLMPLAFIISIFLSKNDPKSKLPGIVFSLAGMMTLALVLGMALLQKQSASSLTFLGALFILLLAPLFTGLWGFLDKFKANPSKPLKNALGLLFAGLAFIPLGIAAGQVSDTHAMASVWWLVLAYFILELGEMCLSPVSLSAVTQLSVPRVVSLMMGTWFLATAFSEVLAGEFGKLAALDNFDASKLTDIADAATKFGDLFWLMTKVGIGCAVVALLLVPILKKLMHGVK
jgi:proton-dependent oligopeptide transporter, POT family